MTISERVAYIKGLAEGLKLDPEKPETRIINELISLMDDVAEEIGDVSNIVDELAEYAEELDHDLGDVESYVFECDDDDEDDDYDYDDDECGCGCCGDDWDECDCDCDDDEFDEDFDEDDLYEIECPHCGETVVFLKDAEPETMICPACNKKISDAD